MEDLKMFSVRLPRDLWIFLKKRAAEQDTSMGEILINSIRKLKKKYDRRLLTDNETNV